MLVARAVMFTDHNRLLVERGTLRHLEGHPPDGRLWCPFMASFGLGTREWQNQGRGLWAACAQAAEFQVIVGPSQRCYLDLPFPATYREKT